MTESGPKVSAWGQMMAFLDTAAGKHLIATGKFNTSGLELVNGLRTSVKDITLGVSQLANDINRGVIPPPPLGLLHSNRDVSHVNLSGRDSAPC